MSPRLVIFDCDGTLVDSQHLIHAAMAEAFDRADREAPGREAVRAIVGLSLAEAVSRLLPPDEAGDAKAVAVLVAGYREAFQGLRADPAHAEPMYEGAREALDRLAACPRTLMAMATGKSRRGVAHLLEREGLEAHFQVIKTADDAPSKPHPGMIEAALAESGLGGEQAVMIGDTSFDMEMAANAGVAALGVGWGYHPPQALAQAGAARVLAAFHELDEALEMLLPPAREAAS